MGFPILARWHPYWMSPQIVVDFMKKTLKQLTTRPEEGLSFHLRPVATFTEVNHFDDEIRIFCVNTMYGDVLMVTWLLLVARSSAMSTALNMLGNRVLQRGRTQISTQFLCDKKWWKSKCCFHFFKPHWLELAGVYRIPNLDSACLCQIN